MPISATLLVFRTFRPIDPDRARPIPPAKPIIFWLMRVSPSARTVRFLRTATSALLPIRAVLLDFATSTPSEAPTPPPAPPATLPADWVRRISLSVSTSRSLPTRTVLLSPISASTVSLTTDTLMIPP